MKNNIKLKEVLLVILIMIMTGCAHKSKVINMDPNGNHQATKGLTNDDFRKAAHSSIASMVKSGALNKRGGGRYVLVISDIINDTMQRIDTDQLIKKIRISLLQSGKVVVTTAMSANGAEDKMSMKVRTLRGSSEFNGRTIAKRGQMIAPDLSLSGKIIQKNVEVDSDTVRIEYYFQLTLTELNTGLAFWEGEVVLGKQASSDSASW